MRSNKELLKVFLENTECFKSGLCIWIDTLKIRGIISGYEFAYIMKLIRENKPFIAKLLGKAYYWKSGKINPRIKFLKKHLK